ncbi:MAG: competence/damage-inducible protein A [Alkalispirochaetaceae bacterium]
MIAVVLVGDEILSAQVRDENLFYIIDRLSEAGYETGEARIIRDDIEQIARTFRELSRKYEYVISAGGVGPTHDDVTLDGVARAFGVPLELNEKMKAFLSGHHGEDMGKAVVKMAMLPAGSEVDTGNNRRWPLVRKENCFILPGLPRALRDKIDRIVATLPLLDRSWIAKLYLSSTEDEIAEWLGELQERYPGVAVGSYPVLDEKRYTTRITFRGTDREAVNAACEEAAVELERHLVGRDFPEPLGGSGA